MKTLKIALLQLTPEANAEAATKSGVAACREAAANGADIALFPEMWSNGYAYTDHRDPGAGEAWMAAAVRPDSPFVRSFQHAAKELNMAVAITYLETHEPRPRNSVTIFDRLGRRVLHYSKIHICTFETECFCSPGDKFLVAMLETRHGPVQIGAMICFDREFPESARVLALLGAELVLVPNACVFDDHRTMQMQTRAFENKVALAMTNYPDTHIGGNGSSLAVSPIAWELDGTNPRSQYRETLMLRTGPGPGIHYCEFDLDAIRHYRENAIWGTTFRQPQTYDILIDSKLVPVYKDNPALIH